MHPAHRERERERERRKNHVRTHIHNSSILIQKNEFKVTLSVISCCTVGLMPMLVRHPYGAAFAPGRPNLKKELKTLTSQAANPTKRSCCYGYYLTKRCYHHLSNTHSSRLERDADDSRRHEAASYTSQVRKKKLFHSKVKTARKRGNKHIT